MINCEIIGGKQRIHKYMALQFSKLFHFNVSTGQLPQDSQGSYINKIQNIGGLKLSEEKNLVFHWRYISYFLFVIQIDNFVKKRHQHSCSPVSFAKFLRTFVLKKICEQQLLDWHFIYLSKSIFCTKTTWSITRNTNKILFYKIYLQTIRDIRILYWKRGQRVSKTILWISLPVIVSIWIKK